MNSPRLLWLTGARVTLGALARAGLLAIVAALLVVACGSGAARAPAMPAPSPADRDNKAAPADSAAPTPAPTTPSDAPKAASQETNAGGTPATPGAPDATPAADDTTPKVTLIDPGAAPRRKLRYAFTMTQENMLIDMKISMNINMGGGGNQVDMPTMRMLMAITPKQVTPDGWLTYEAAMTRVELLNDATVSKTIRDKLQGDLSSMVGMKIHGMISEHGVAKDVTVDLPPGMVESARESIEKMRDSLRNMCAPLPEQEVGVGAKWRVDMTIVTPIRLAQQTEYALTELPAGSYKANVTVHQQAPQQFIDVSAKAPGASSHLDRMSTTGAGKVAARLDRLTPSSSITTDTSMTTTTEAGGQRVTMQMKLNNLIRVKSR